VVRTTRKPVSYAVVQMGAKGSAFDASWVISMTVFAHDPSGLVFDHEFDLLLRAMRPRATESLFRSCNESARSVPSVCTAHDHWDAARSLLGVCGPWLSSSCRLKAVDQQVPSIAVKNRRG